MIREKINNISTIYKYDLVKLNELWDKVTLLPRDVLLREYGRSLPALDIQDGELVVKFDKKELTKLMIQNDPEQVMFYIKSHGVELPIELTKTQLLDIVLKLEEFQPGFIWELWKRFNPMINKRNLNDYYTRLLATYDYYVQSNPGVLTRKGKEIFK